MSRWSAADACDDCEPTASSQQWVPMRRSFRSARQYQRGGTASVRSPSFHSLALQFWVIGFNNPTKPQLGIFQTTINTLSSVAWPRGGGGGGGEQDRGGNWSRGNKWGKRGRSWIWGSENNNELAVKYTANIKKRHKQLIMSASSFAAWLILWGYMYSTITEHGIRSLSRSAHKDDGETNAWQKIIKSWPQT